MEFLYHEIVAHHFTESHANFQLRNLIFFAENNHG